MAANVPEVGGVEGTANAAQPARKKRRSRLQPSIESIELYCRICDCIRAGKKHSLTGVADALGCFLSAVSTCLKTWKDIRGAELVNLAQSPIVLFPAGEALHRMARDVLAAHQVMRTPSPPGAGEEVVVGVGNVFIRPVLTRVAALFLAQPNFKGASLRLISEREGAIRALEDGEAHFVLASSGFRRRHPWLHWEKLNLTLDLVAITRKQDPLKAPPGGLTDELLEKRIVCLEEDDAQLLRFPQRIVVTNYASIGHFVREVGAVGIVPVFRGLVPTGLEEYRKDFRVFRLNLKTRMEPWELGIWTRQNATLTRSAEAFLGVLKTFLEKSAKPSP